ncbi:MAG: hypothetical protein GY866_41445, partial [Proteobacteria bacterium]|nr:hypothetical protein [Pseudomonadota bacterium]
MMNISYTVATVCLVLNTLVLALAHFMANAPVWAFSVIPVGLLWWYGQKRNWKGLTLVVFLIYVAQSVHGIFLGASLVLMSISLTASLLVWDLDYLHLRLQRAEHVINRDKIVQRHLKRWQNMAVLTFMLVAVALSAEFELDFVWIVLIALVLASFLGK